MKKEARKEAREELKKLKEEAKEEEKRIKDEQKELMRQEREKYPSASLRRKARKIRWKQEKRERRRALRERYQDAPWYIKVPRVYLLKPLVCLCIIGVLVGGAAYAIPLVGYKILDENKNAPVAQKEIEKISPVDRKGAGRIDAIAPVDKKDTWTICLYISGSNLEDMDENDLSNAVQAQIEEVKEQSDSEAAASKTKRLNRFTGELEANDLEMPAYLYYPKEPVPSDEDGEEADEDTEEETGAATRDIDEVTSGVWSDNIRIVIQTGGATRWSNPMVNPNRTQRFLYYKGELEKVYDQPIERVTDSKTLTSFLKFCRKEYPADHNMLILWNHGGGAFGYGHDSIYGSMMSLKDIRAGLEGAYKPNAEDPPFDIIGYDACLMSSVEVAHAMRGFASYYAVSEEVEPDEGWNYGAWLKAMTKDPTMSPARVARHIADSYMDYYMTQNVNMGWLASNAVSFSVLDAKKAEELYKAYCDLTKKQLQDATEDRSVIAEIGRCSNKSTHLVSFEYNHYNTIDLGNYVDNMADTYPQESDRIRKLIGETVLYHRENGTLCDTQGISIYLPGSVDDFDGMMVCLKYVYEICEDPATRALYYYMVAGCLNEDMQKYLRTITGKEMPAIDLKPFVAFAEAKPRMTDEGFEIPVDDKLRTMLQSHDVEVAYYDKDHGILKSYGRDELARLDGEGNMNCEFDGTWICLDGEPLATEVAASTPSMVEYRSKVRYNGKKAYLSFIWDKDKEEFAIKGVRVALEDGLAGSIFNDLYMPDPVNYLVNSRMNTQLNKGDEITPIYDTSEVKPQEDDENKGNDTETGKTIKIKKSSTIKIEKLPDGRYLNSAVISDTRGDVYYSQVVGCKVSGGKVKDRKVDSSFMGMAY